MTRDQAVARIKQGLGFRSDLDTESALMLQEAQRFFEQGKTLPWFLLQETATVSLVTATDPHLVLLPTDFLREADQRRVYFTNSDSEKVVLTKKSFNEAFDAYKDEDAGAPEVYSLLSTHLYFFPAAEVGATYTITFPYYKRAVLLDTNVENAWLLNVPELLIGEAGFRLAADMRDERAMKLPFDSMRKQAWDSVFRETIAREEAALRQAMGSDL